jgi:orotate phosphoribosyltransferase
MQSARMFTMAVKKSSNEKSSNSKSDTNLLTMTAEDAKSDLRELIEKYSMVDRDSILRSGRITSVFFDLKETILSSRGSFLTAICMLNMLKPNVKAVGGNLDSCYSLSVATSMLANISGQPIDCFYVKPEGHAKPYGKTKFIDGPLRPGTKVCLIQDLVTSGTNMVQMIRKLKDELDVEVIQVISLLDRNDGAINRFDELGVDYNYVFSVKEFVKEEIYSNY